MDYSYNNEVHWLEPSSQRWTQQCSRWTTPQQHIAATPSLDRCFDKRHLLVSSVRGCDGMIAGFKDLSDFIKQALLSPTLTSHLSLAYGDSGSHKLARSTARGSGFQCDPQLYLTGRYPLLGPRVGLLALKELCIPHRAQRSEHQTQAVGVVLPSPISYREHSVGSSCSQQAQQQQ